MMVVTVGCRGGGCGDYSGGGCGSRRRGFGGFDGGIGCTHVLVMVLV